MKLFTGETGKIYCFENSKLKYISETRICKRLFSSVYVITYFDGEGNRTAVETQAANHSGNEKAKRFLYNRFYGKSLLPISSKRFKELSS